MEAPLLLLFVPPLERPKALEAAFRAFNIDCCNIMLAMDFKKLLAKSVNASSAVFVPSAKSANALEKSLANVSAAEDAICPIVLTWMLSLFS